ncbi:MAG: phosphoribosylformylglycinamidine synthase II, partial [Deltaproteobacteria bacterium]|nr:phosphoribosylformylglycinamidine synthase II [Deltaproteobacteria bacterium]
VGLMPDASRALAMGFAGAGHAVAVIGDVGGKLGASEYLEVCRGQARGAVQTVAAGHRAVCDAVRGLVAQGLLASCHDISEGGIAVALAECAVGGGIGCKVELPGEGRADELLFGEGPGRFVISYDPANGDAIRSALGDVALTEVGKTGGDHVDIAGAGHSIALPLAELGHAYTHGFDHAVD